MGVNTKSGVFTYNNKEFPFEFKTSLGAGEKLRFTKAVMNSIITDELYCYVIKSLIFDFEIVEFFAEINLEDIIEEHEDGTVRIHAIEEFIENSDIVDVIKDNVDPGVVEELEKSVDLNVAYITGIQLNPVADALSEVLNAIERKISMVNLDDLLGATRAMSNISGEFTMDKLIEAYGKSDLFKQTVSGVKDAEIEKKGAAEVKNETTGAKKPAAQKRTRSKAPAKKE